MARRRRRQRQEEPREVTIESMSHEGRGIAHVNGKTVFVFGALAGERVLMQVQKRNRKYDQATTLEVIEPSPQRIEPRCEAYQVCGGCSLQHLDPAVQIQRKQAVLAEQLEHFGGLRPDRWLEPLTGPVTGYRGKARLGVKYVDAKGDTLVGFREKRNSLIADLAQCEVLIPEVGHRFRDLRALINGLD